MRSENEFSSSSKNLAIPNNCQGKVLPPPVQEFAELLAEIAARRLHKTFQKARNELEQEA